MVTARLRNPGRARVGGDFGRLTVVVACSAGMGTWWSNVDSGQEDEAQVARRTGWWSGQRRFPPFWVFGSRQRSKWRLKYFLGRSSVDFESAGDQDVASTEKTLRGTGPGWANSSGLTHGDIHPAELLRYNVARYRYKRDEKDARVGTLDFLERGPGGDQEGTRRGQGRRRGGPGREVERETRPRWD